MSTKSEFSIVGLAHKVCLTAEAQGYTPELLNALAEHPSLFRDLLNVQRGLSEIKAIEHVIDCDADPFLPNEDWKVEEHRNGGILVWDPAKVDLYLSKGQKGDKYLEGNKLRRELADKPVLNANVLDYILAHPHLIPEEWKGKAVFFWGTIYRCSRDNLFVRFLYWYGGRWDWYYFWLVYDFDSGNPALVRAS